MSSLFIRLSGLFFETRFDSRRPQRRTLNAMPALLLLAGIACFGPISAQLGDADDLGYDKASYKLAGSASVLDAVDDIDPLPPATPEVVIARVGKAGLTALYFETWVQGPSQPPATPPPISL